MHPPAGDDDSDNVHTIEARSLVIQWRVVDINGDLDVWRLENGFLDDRCERP
jgi:hypothetical protein